MPGTNLVYTLVVRNDGPSDATGVQVIDPTPAGLTFVSNAGDCTSPFPCALGTVPAGTTRTITTTFAMPAGYSGANPVANTATVSSVTGDPAGANDSATASTPVQPTADVSVAKTGPSTAAAGGTVTYTVMVRNAGPSDAPGVVVTDPTPAGLGFAANSGDCSTPFPCALGTLPAGATRTITTTLINAAPDADVAVRKTVDNPTPNVGETVIFLVEVTNRGPSPATDVVVGDMLPPGLTLQSATPSQGSFASGSWTVGTLAPGATATLALAVLVDTPGAAVNVAARSTQNEVDPNPANDDATAGVNAGTSADLQVTKTVSNATPPVGTNATFTVTVRNNGPSPASGVAIADALPAGLTFVSATASLGAYDAGAGIWTVGSLAATQSAVLSIAARADSDETLTNTASVASATEPDPMADNNTASAELTPVFVTDLAMAKTDGAATVTPGLPLTYTVTVSNAGPSPAVGARVVDPLAPELIGAMWTCETTAPGMCQPAMGAGSIDALVDLPAGTTATFSVTATLLASTPPGTLANKATVTPPSTATDPDPSNDSSTDTSTVVPASDLAIGKVQSTPAPPAPASAGGTVVYTITVSNAGPSDATGVVVDDPTPTGLVFGGNTGACTTPFPCTLGVLPAGQPQTIVATYTLPADYDVPPGTAPDPISNGASVSSPTLDPNPSNDTSITTTPLGAPVTDLSVTKSNGTTTVVPGQATTYTIVVSNAGPAAAVGARVSDVLPAGAIGANWTCTPGPGATCPPSGSGDINALVTLPSGATVTFTATVTLSPTAAGTFANTVTVSAPAGAADPTPASATDTDAIERQADLSITKAGPATIVPGDLAAYTIVVTNNGPSEAPNVQVADPTPPDAVFVATSGDCTTAFPCVLGTLQPGEIRTITATFQVPLGYPRTTLVNTASVQGGATDPDPSDSSATVTTDVNLDADVAVTKAVNPSDSVRSATR